MRFFFHCAHFDGLIWSDNITDGNIHVPREYYTYTCTFTIQISCKGLTNKEWMSFG
jgi:hypothetical protein